MNHQDFVFADGNRNNIEVLNKNDLSLVGILNTENHAVFCMHIVGQKVFAGCSGNNLYVFELDPALKQPHEKPIEIKSIKCLKSSGIIYSFF